MPTARVSLAQLGAELPDQIQDGDKVPHYIRQISDAVQPAREGECRSMVPSIHGEDSFICQRILQGSHPRRSVASSNACDFRNVRYLNLDQPHIPRVDISVILEGRPSGAGGPIPPTSSRLTVMPP